MNTLEGKVEIDKFELTTKVAIFWSAFGAILFLLFGSLFQAIFSTRSTIKLPLVGVITTVAVLVIHELLHGVVIRFLGTKPKYGVGIKFIMPYFYATAPDVPYTKSQFLPIALAPLFIISIVGATVGVIFPTVAPYLFVPLVMNAAGSVGDLWLVARAVKAPRNTLIVDAKTGVIVYGDEKAKASINKSDGSFFNIFGLIFSFQMGLTFILAPLCGFLLNHHNFTLGLESFYIFKYTSIAKGESYQFNLMAIIAVSLVATLLYAFLRRLSSGRHKQALDSSSSDTHTNTLQ